MEQDQERWYTVEQVAEQIQVHPETVRQWLREGKLLGTLLSRRAGYRVAGSEVDAIMRGGLRPGIPERAKSEAAPLAA
jgi:excisionase family DNA binding protein